VPHRFVSYLQVSTDRQGRSGLGLEAQRAAVAAHLAGGARTLLDEMVEVESGKATADRPQLARAMALVAQQEREATSARTKAALAAAKARGTKLGGYRGVPPPDPAKADLFASRVGPLVRELQVSDMTMEAIARELATRGVRTARGGAWTGQAVKNLLARGMGQ